MKKNIMIIIISITVILLIGVIMYYTTDETQEEREIYINNYLKDIGYTYNEETRMFEKTPTNNTLDDFYKAQENNQSTTYQNYYFTLDSYNFIELNMKYTKEVTETFTITSDLKNDTITYNYEITKNNATAILEGEYDDKKDNPFTCKVVTLKKLNESHMDQFCKNAKENTISFINEENKVLNNQEFQEKISIPRREIIVKED